MSCRHYVFSTHTCLVTTLGLFTGTDWQWRRGTWKLLRDRSILAKSKMPDVRQDWKWKRFPYLSTLLHRYSHRPLLIEIQGVRNSPQGLGHGEGHHHHQCLSCCYFLQVTLTGTLVHSCCGTWKHFWTWAMVIHLQDHSLVYIGSTFEHFCIAFPCQ